MSQPIWLQNLLVIPLLLAGQPILGTRAPRPIAETDLYRLRWVADPELSPDGSRIAYVQVTVNSKRDGYETGLWIAPADGGASRRLTSGSHDLAPAWSPDGRSLAFLRSVKDSGEQQPPQVYLLRDNGLNKRFNHVKNGRKENLK